MSGLIRSISINCRSNAASVDHQPLYSALVRTLYSTPKSVFSASVVALMLIALSGELSADRFYAVFFAAFLVVGIARSALILLFRNRQDAENADSTKYWERAALLGAWIFAGLVGLIGAFTVVAHPGTDVEILISCCVMGYIAGISSRNASRPLITIGQVSCTCIPFILALIWRADAVHLALALFIAILYVSTIVMCRTVFENIVARHEAFRKFETLAQRDALTDLWNRSAFLHLLEHRLESMAGRIIPSH
jgi:hypothetical protein